MLTQVNQISVDPSHCKFTRVLGFPAEWSGPPLEWQHNSRISQNTDKKCQNNVKFGFKIVRTGQIQVKINENHQQHNRIGLVQRLRRCGPLPSP